MRSLGRSSITLFLKRELLLIFRENLRRSVFYKILIHTPKRGLNIIVLNFVQTEFLDCKL